MNISTNEELKSLTIEELKKKIASFRGDLLTLRLGNVAQPVQDKSSFKKLKKAIARALTFLTQRINEQQQSSDKVGGE